MSLAGAIAPEKASSLLTIWLDSLSLSVCLSVSLLVCSHHRNRTNFFLRAGAKRQRNLYSNSGITRCLRRRYRAGERHLRWGRRCAPPLRRFAPVCAPTGRNERLRRSPATLRVARRRCAPVCAPAGRIIMCSVSKLPPTNSNTSLFPRKILPDTFIASTGSYGSTCTKHTDFECSSAINRRKSRMSFCLEEFQRKQNFYSHTTLCFDTSGVTADNDTRRSSQIYI